MVIWSYLGLIAVGWVFYVFIRNLGKTVPILELSLLIAGLQWIVGAFIEYRTAFVHFKYYMYVEENVYMGYVVPAYIVFTVTLLYSFKKARRMKISVESLYKYSNFGLKIFVLGFIADFLSPFIPGQLGFVSYLLGLFKYVGAIILYFSKVKRHRYFLYIALLLLIFQSLAIGMFHSLLTWLVFFYMFWAYKTKPTMKFSVLIIVFGFVFTTVIQSVKSDYRSFVWSGYSGNKASLFLKIISTKFSGGFNDSPEETEGLNVRLNQGWIISAIMDHTPQNQPYANGETVVESIGATIVPRFLVADKKLAGGRANFMKYTGLYLDENTTMAMSVLGEAYANFGGFGGIIFMGLWGLFLSFVWGFLSKKIVRNNIIYFFIPLIFSQVIKAETELLTVLNHLIKSMILVFVFLWFNQSVLKLSLKNFSNRRFHSLNFNKTQ